MYEDGVLKLLETDFFDKLLDDWADGLLYPEIQAF
jgi:hypothetical protein